MKVRDLLSERVRDIENVRYFENPTRQQVISLAAKHDLRGTSDGTSIWVWDANLMIHHNAKWWLKDHGDFYTSPVDLPNGKTLQKPNENVKTYFNFYVSNAKVRARAGTKEGWIKDKLCIFYQLDENTRVSVKKPLGAKLEEIPAFARIVRGAPRSDQDPAA